MSCSCELRRQLRPPFAYQRLSTATRAARADGKAAKNAAKVKPRLLKISKAIQALG